MSLILRRFRPDPPLLLRRFGPDLRLAALAARDPLAPLAAAIGPPGNVARHEHTQSSAAALWTVNHNLGLWPSAVTVLSPGGVEVNAEVVHVTVNQLTIHFAAAYAGTARIF